MKRRFFVGTAMAGIAGIALRRITDFSTDNSRLIICISGIRKSDAVKLGWYLPLHENINASDEQPWQNDIKILPLRRTEHLLFSAENNHLDKLCGLLNYLGLSDAEQQSRKLREQCLDEPLILKQGRTTLFYYDGLEAGHSNEVAYFESLKKAEKWVNRTLIDHSDRYGEKASYVICSEMGRDETTCANSGAIHHNSPEAAYGFVSYS